MTDIIPYFAGAITIIFGLAFYIALQEFKKVNKDDFNENE